MVNSSTNASTPPSTLHKQYTLYVDGACKGNPGKGGWGAYIIDPEQGEQELFGGAEDTTNNRMELTAAIEGIRACPRSAQLTIYTDSNYVKQGITEWITGWKAKNWKNVKNPDLWQTLDEVTQEREIDWHWIKGHAGHAGNERADQLANKGVDSLQSTTATPSDKSDDKKKVTESDWLLDDPFGLDATDSTEETDLSEDTDHLEEVEEEVTDEISDESIISTPKSEIKAQIKENMHIKITETTNPQVGERLLILDTETTGFYYQDSDRIIEVGAIEMINRKLTGSSIHIYINPEKPVGESENIHGISDEFLKDKPKFAAIADTLFAYLEGAEIVAHNASFDMNFLDAEFERVLNQKLSSVCKVTDTLAIAKRKHPGQKNSLDILVKRYEIPPRDRTFHGALLDAEILADVYLAMTGGQVSFSLDQHHQNSASDQSINTNTITQHDIPLIFPTESELEAHQAWINHFKEKNEKDCLFAVAEAKPLES